MTLLKHIAGIFCLMLFSTQVTGQLEWSVPMLTADSGDVIGVDILVSGYEGLISSQGTVEFDEAILEYSHVDSFALSSMSTSSFGETQVNNGLLSFSWFESDLVGREIPDGDAAFRIFFNVIGNPGDTSTIELVNQPVVGEFVDTMFTPVAYTYQAGRVIVNASSAYLGELEVFADVRVFPNPASNWIQIGGFPGEKIELAWYTLEGNLIHEEVLQDQQKEIKVSTEELSSGVYLMRFGNRALGFDNRLIQIQ